MAKFLLDTNVPSEMTRPSPDQGVIAWMRAAVEDDLCLSVISLAELNRGIERMAAGRKQTAFRDWLVALVARFDGRILPITSEIALAAGWLEAASTRAGRQMEFADALMAGTARVHGLTLVTRNVKDFQAVPVQLHNPWSGP